jgi:hypothetical protein
MISTHAQCTATIEDVLMQLQKVMAQVGSQPKLLTARRDLQDVLKLVQKKSKPSAEQIRNLKTGCDAIRGLPLRMPELHNQLYDIEDFVDTL